MDLRFTIQATLISIFMAIGMIMFVIVTTPMANAAYEQNFVDDAPASAGAYGLMFLIIGAVWLFCKMKQGAEEVRSRRVAEEWRRQREERSEQMRLEREAKAARNAESVRKFNEGRQRALANRRK